VATTAEFCPKCGAKTPAGPLEVTAVLPVDDVSSARNRRDYSSLLVFGALAFTVIFIAAELHYNIDLLNTLSDLDAARSKIDNLSLEGKLIASAGISWALFRGLLKKLPRFPPQALGYLFVSLLVYLSISALYTEAIKGLPREVKVDGFHLFAYRHDLLAGKVIDPEIPLPRDEPVLGRIIMTSFPLVMFEERYMLPARDILARKVEDKTRYALQKAQEGWPRYNAMMQRLDRGHADFVVQSRKAIQYRSFGGVDRFRRESSGMEPNPELVLKSFLSAGMKLVASPAAIQVMLLAEPVVPPGYLSRSSQLEMIGSDKSDQLASRAARSDL
jgi:hypothetical protein